jgi:hypothetical protein
MAEAKMDIGVFSDNQAVFSDGVAVWRQRVPAYIYLASDGALPDTSASSPYTNKPAMLTCYWLNRNPYSAGACPTNISTLFTDGQSQETCRDYVHFGLGMASILNSAETGRIQGVDLYGEQQNRLVAALEYNTHILNTVHSHDGYPAGFCDNSATLKTPYTAPTYEIGYSEYAERLGIPMPNTLQTIDRLRAAGGTGTDHVMAWETLTNGDLGLAGF